jgi:hypothetical protein
VGRSGIAKRIISGYTVQGSGNDWEESCYLRESLVDMQFREVGLIGKKWYS